MKRLFALSLLLLLFMASRAQDEDLLENYHHQVSLNATAFIGNYLSFNNTIVSNSPYLVTYKYLMGTNAIRTGFGIQTSTSNNNPNTGQVITKFQSSEIAFRIGYEKQHRLNKRWLFYAGADVIYGYDLTRSTTASIQGFPPKTVEVTSDTEAFGTGGGGVLGIELKLGKRISINTETTAYFVYGESRRRITNPAFPNFNTNEFTASRGFNIIIPTSVFFVLHF